MSLRNLFREKGGGEEEEVLENVNKPSKKKLLESRRNIVGRIKLGG